MRGQLTHTSLGPRNGPLKEGSSATDLVVGDCWAAPPTTPASSPDRAGRASELRPFTTSEAAPSPLWAAGDHFLAGRPTARNGRAAAPVASLGYTYRPEGTFLGRGCSDNKGNNKEGT